MQGVNRSIGRVPLFSKKLVVANGAKKKRDVVTCHHYRGTGSSGNNNNTHNNTIVTCVCVWTTRRKPHEAVFAGHIYDLYRRANPAVKLPLSHRERSRKFTSGRRLQEYIRLGSHLPFSSPTDDDGPEERESPGTIQAIFDPPPHM